MAPGNSNFKALVRKMAEHENVPYQTVFNRFTVDQFDLKSLLDLVEYSVSNRTEYSKAFNGWVSRMLEAYESDNIHKFWVDLILSGREDSFWAGIPEDFQGDSLKLPLSELEKVTTVNSLLIQQSQVSFSGFEDDPQGTFAYWASMVYGGQLEYLNFDSLPGEISDTLFLVGDILSTHPWAAQGYEDDFGSWEGKVITASDLLSMTPGCHEARVRDFIRIWSKGTGFTSTNDLKLGLFEVKYLIKFAQAVQTS